MVVAGAQARLEGGHPRGGQEAWTGSTCLVGRDEGGSLVFTFQRIVAARGAQQYPEVTYEWVPLASHVAHMED
eukprot:2368355-Pyramimonas_sp.AAC.1